MASEPVTAARNRVSGSQARFRFKEKSSVSRVHCECGVDDRECDVYERADGARCETTLFEFGAEKISYGKPRQKEK